MWVLKIHDPGTKRWEYTIKPGKNLIGRDVTNDIQLNKHSISRQHVRLDYSRAEDTVLLRDLDSTNGTFINDEKIISPQYLQHGDLIKVGSATLRALNPITKKIKPLNWQKVLIQLPGNYSSSPLIHMQFYK